MSFTESLADLVTANRNQLLSIHTSWERVPLSDVATIQNGFPFESKFFTSSDGMPLIRIRDVLEGETETYYTADYDEAFVVQRDDLLIGMDGDFHCSLWAGRPALLNQRVCRLFPQESFYDRRFLRYALPGYLSAINSATSSITVKHLSSRTVADIPLPLPPLPEQHRIVEKIEELFSDLDAGVASLERAKANLKRYRASVLKSAVAGRLTEDWREEHPQTEDGAFLEDNWVPLEEVITLLGQGWSPKCESAPATDDTEWAVIKTSAIQSMVFLPDENKQLPDTLTPRHELVIEPGDLLITRAGPRTRAGVTCLVRHTRPRLILCDKAYRVRFNETRVFPAFVEVVLNAPYFLDRLDELKTGISDSGVNLTQKKFVELAIPLPPLAEQKQIVALVEERLSQIDSAEKTINQELIRSKRLRQSILKRAFEGKLVAQDPNDEPASVLLERIKASREQEQPKKRVKKAKKAKAK